MTSPSAPLDASTVVLVRPTSPSDPEGSFEVFLLQRHTRSRFMPGAYVYPGGRLDPIDTSPDVPTMGRTPQGCAEALQEPETPPSHALSLFTAALRESYEEAGVLLVRRADGSDPDLPADWLRAQRKAVHDDHALWPKLLRDHGLALDLGAMHPIAHWITPEAEPRRFDTRFFIALCPAWQREALLHDTRETIDSLWLSPAEAILRHRAGTLMLPPPTFRTLEDLAAFDKISSVFEALPNIPIPAVLPLHQFIDDALHIILPGDPDHPTPLSALPKPLSKPPKRLILREGYWESVP